MLCFSIYFVFFFSSCCVSFCVGLVTACVFVWGGLLFPVILFPCLWFFFSPFCCSSPTWCVFFVFFRIRPRFFFPFFAPSARSKAVPPHTFWPRFLLEPFVTTAGPPVSCPCLCVHPPHSPSKSLLSFSSLRVASFFPHMVPPFIEISSRL